MMLVATHYYPDFIIHQWILYHKLKKKKKKLAHLEISGTNSSYYRQETESQNNRICPLLYKVMAESSLELIIFSLIHL